MSNGNIVLDCPYAKKCGGCQLQNMDYERQLKFKMAKVVKLLGKFHRVSEIIGTENPYHYRNKVQVTFGRTRAGKTIAGNYQPSSHCIVNIDRCLLNSEKADEIIEFIKQIMPNFRMFPYNEDTKSGFLRHILVKNSFSTGEIMVVLVAGRPEFPQRKEFLKKLLTEFPDITTVLFNVNGEKTSMILGEKEEILYGKGYIEDELCGCRFRISAKSFYQVNARTTPTLYKTAIGFAGLSGKETVIDAYCGTGTIGLVASKRSMRVLGVELNADAVQDAKTNAKLNDITNAEFYQGDAGRFMRDLAAHGEKADVVIMDPPRAGSDKTFLNSVLKLSPAKIVYVSCNPETLRRDLFTLTQGGYKVRKIQPIDMFPHTEHVETVVLLSKKQSECQRYIEIGFDADEY